jgi:uncharacterized membrane protein|tara:strand:+ start:137 stop:298 length:162 start_codon:yes stop_codon:yes gene_type:complete
MLLVTGIVFVFTGALLKVLKFEYSSIVLSIGLIIEVFAVCTVFYEMNYKNKSS